MAGCSKTVDIAVTDVKVNPTDKRMYVGETFTPVATVSPENATDKVVTWISNNPAVATVNETTGLVTAVTIGEAKITATAGGRGAVCEVRVVATPVTGVALSRTTLELDVTETATLTATLTPAGATDSEKVLTWTTNAATVATVDSAGKVTAVGPGTATITATAKSGAKGECVVTVNNIPVTKITITAKNSTTAQANFNLDLVPGVAAPYRELAVVVEPTTATVKTATWKSSNTDVATVDANGKVTAVAEGTATITATSNDTPEDDDDDPESDTVVVTVRVEKVTLNKSTTSIVAGADETLTATVVLFDSAADRSVIWDTLNSDKATVDQSGKVTGVAAGTARIRVTSVEKPELTAICTVIVTAAPAP